jgi:hypothetical protein
MKHRRERPYIETALESLGGSLGVFVGGTLGPFIDSDVSSVTGSMAGAVAGVILAKSEIVSSTLADFDAFMHVSRCVNAKFEADMRHCDLFRGDRYEQAKKDAVKVLKGAKVIGEGGPDERIPEDEDWQFPGKVEAPATLAHLALRLAQQGVIKINCSVISVAAIATISSLAKRYEQFGLKLEIHTDFRNGREQMRALEARGPYDFIIAPNDPFFLAPDSLTRSYRLVGPTNGEIQHLFRRKAEHNPKSARILTYAESSAEIHFRAGIGIPRNSDPEYIEDAFTIAKRLSDLGGGDYVLVWEPLAYLMDTTTHKNNYEKCEGSRHTVQFSLYCHKSWRHNKRKSLRDAFKQLFRNEWLYCYRTMHQHVCRLQEDDEFMRNFALGCGMVLPNSAVVRAVHYLRLAALKSRHMQSPNDHNG